MQLSPAVDESSSGRRRALVKEMQCCSRSKLKLKGLKLRRDYGVDKRGRMNSLCCLGVGA